MNRFYFPVILFVLILLGFFSCQESFEPVYDVPEELQPYIDRFLEEAEKRGLNFQINNLIIRYDAEIGVGICGICNSNAQQDDIQKIIRINPNCNFTYDQQIEALIFHELGHCFLGRLHESTLLPNGDPKSLMIINDVNVYSICIFPIDNQPCDARFKRDYYLDELFDENTAVPEWAK